QSAGLPQLGRQDRQDLVPVDNLSVGVHSQAAVGVTVVGDTGVGAVQAYGLLEGVQVGGAVPLVDVVAVGGIADRDDLGTRPAQGFGSDSARSAVRTVHDDLQPVQTVPQGRDDVFDITLGSVDSLGD